MSFQRVAILLLLVGLILVLRFQLGSEGAADGNFSVRKGEREVLITAGAGTETEAATTTAKSRERQSEEEVDMLDTFAALKVPLPGLTEFPEQTLQERILALNALLKKSGSFLRFGVDEEMYPSQNLLEMKVPAFSKENATPNNILLNDSRAMNRHHLISNGMVLYQDGSGG